MRCGIVISDGHFQEGRKAPRLKKFALILKSISFTHRRGRPIAHIDGRSLGKQLDISAKLGQTYKNASTQVQPMDGKTNC